MTFTAAFLLVSIAPLAPEAPNRQPQLAAGNGVVGLVFGAGKTVYFASSRDEGHTFSAPVKVGETEILPLTRHRGPRVVITPQAIVVTAVGGKTVKTGPHAHGLPSDGDLLAWRSTDAGRTWSGPVVVNDAAGSASEGLHALAADRNGRVMAVWQDQRSPGMKLYSSRSDDGGVSWSANVLAYASPDGSVCQCCHPSLVADPNGGFLMMWRNALGGARDMYLARSADGRTFTAPRKLGQGTWEINACPMDGGGLAIADGRVVTAWRRGSEAYLAEPDRREKMIGKGKDITVASSQGTVWVAWTSPNGIEVWNSRNGSTQRMNPAGAYPMLLTVTGGRTLVAYELDGSIAIQRAESRGSVTSETSGL